MLAEALKPIGFDTFGKESWDDYRQRLGLPEEYAVQQFYRQVVYDHFLHFNDHYPDFNIEDYRIEVEYLSAQEANNLIRFFNDEAMDWWGEQYEEFKRENFDYIIFQEMSKNLTFPFPPILIEPTKLKGEGWRACGHPLHLIEGTHRVSYLRHMLSEGITSPDSKHQFIILRPREA